MQVEKSYGRKIFLVLNAVFLILLAAVCIAPVANILAISLSSASAAASGQVKLWPVQFSTQSYQYIIGNKEFFSALIISIKRVLVGVPVNMILTVLIAYPLSKNTHVFRHKRVYAWFFVVTMLFHAGLIPWYFVIAKTGLLDSLFSLILPGAVPVFNMLIMMNFFKTLPDEIEEASFIDGAGHWTSLFKIYIPLSVPAIATLSLFCTVTHWNSWFDGLILMNKTDHYPLQSFLQTIIVERNLTSVSSQEVLRAANISSRTTRSAQILLAALPIVALYIFLQKYFVQGIVVGSVKG